MSERSAGKDLVAGLCAMVFGPLLVVLAFAQAREWIAASRWPEVPATIERIEIGEDYGPSNRSKKKEYVLHAHYRYEWGGQRYEGRRVSWRSQQVRSSFEASLRRTRDAILARETAYVDPRRPSFAVLDRGFPLDIFGLYLGGVFLLALGLKEFDHAQRFSTPEGLTHAIGTTVLAGLGLAAAQVLGLWAMVSPFPVFVLLVLHDGYLLMNGARSAFGRRGDPVLEED